MYRPDHFRILLLSFFNRLFLRTYFFPWFVMSSNWSDFYQTIVFTVLGFIFLGITPGSWCLLWRRRWRRWQIWRQRSFGKIGSNKILDHFCSFWSKQEWKRSKSENETRMKTDLSRGIDFQFKFATTWSFARSALAKQKAARSFGDISKVVLNCEEQKYESTVTVIRERLTDAIPFWIDDTN